MGWIQKDTGWIKVILVADLITTIIEHNPQMTDYLEIGTQTGKTFNRIYIKNKVGVDIVDQKEKFKFTATHITTSQNFIHNINNQTYDIILCDGDRDGKVSSKDIVDSYNILNDNGYIIFQTILTTNPIEEKVPRQSIRWTGDTWKYIQDLQHNKTFPIYLIHTMDENLPYHLVISNNLPFQKTNGNPPMKDFNKLMSNVDEYFHTLTVDELITLMNKKNTSYTR